MGVRYSDPESRKNKYLEQNKDQLDEIKGDIKSFSQKCKMNEVGQINFGD